MMLDVDFSNSSRAHYLPISMLIGGIFLAELLLVVGAWAFGPGVPR
jgi:NADH-quinone oxidoreductase subunit J